MGRAVEGAGTAGGEVHALGLEGGKGGAESGVPVVGLLLAPAGMVVVGRVFGRRLADEISGEVNRGDLAAPGSKVNAKQEFHDAINCTTFRETCAKSKNRHFITTF